MGLVPAAVKPRGVFAVCPAPTRLLAFEWTAAELAPELDVRLAVVGEARGAVRTVGVELWRLSLETAYTVAQIFSELLANAIQHGEPPISISVDQGFTGAVTIAVSDMGDALPELCHDVPEDAERQRGLVVVDALAQAWDVHLRANGGKIVTAVVVPPDLAPTRTHRKRAVQTVPSPSRSALA